MQSSTSHIHSSQTIEKLEALLPAELRSKVLIMTSPIATSMGNLAPISTQFVASNRVLIQVNLAAWQTFTHSQQDLLFLQVIAQIKSRSNSPFSWEFIAISLGLSAASIELPSHSVLSFSVALVVAGLATYRLYQSHKGEQHIRQCTAADQRSIELAMQSGYSFTQAHDSLYEALKILAKQAALKSDRAQYETRLLVLEILRSKRNPLADPISFASVTSQSF